MTIPITGFPAYSFAPERGAVDIMEIYGIRSRAGACRINGCSRGQVALETLLIVSFLLLLLIPIFVYALDLLSNSSWEVGTQQANVAATRIASISNQLSLGGPGTFSTETVFIPSSVVNVYISSGRELTFVVDAGKLGHIDESAVSEANLTLNPASNWTAIKGVNIIMMNVTPDGSVLLTK